MYVAMMLNSLIPCSSELKLHACVWIASHQYCSHIHTYIHIHNRTIYKVSTVKKTSVIILCKAQQYTYVLNTIKFIIIIIIITEYFVNRCTHLCNYNTVQNFYIYQSETLLSCVH